MAEIIEIHQGVSREIACADYILQEIGPLAPETVQTLAISSIKAVGFDHLQGSYRDREPGSRKVYELSKPEDGLIILTRSWPYGRGTGNGPAEWVPEARMEIRYNPYYQIIESVLAFHLPDPQLTSLPVLPYNLERLEDQRDFLAMLKIISSLA